MTSNMANADRVIRVFLGIAAAIAAYLLGPLTLAGAIVTAVAVILLATAAVGFCPLYAVIGVRTNAPRYR